MSRIRTWLKRFSTQRMASTWVEAETVPAKYIYLDVVGFTRGRSVEAQSDIVCFLNDIVRASVAEYPGPADKRIFLPTGDGMCIALLNVESPFDVHVLIAFSILRRVEEHNVATADADRRFHVRIGVGANTDNVVTDINGRRNLAGAGINMTSRVMDLADWNQILVSESVYDTLRDREKYIGCFRPYSATVKHGVSLKLHQCIAKHTPGLNTEVPFRFLAPKKEEPKLPPLVAYYLAHAIRNEEFFIHESKRGRDMEPAVVLLYNLARDSVSVQENKNGFRKTYLNTLLADTLDVTKQYEAYYELGWRVYTDLAEFIENAVLSTHNSYFTLPLWEAIGYCVVNKTGREKLKAEWPAIWKEFSLGKTE